MWIKTLADNKINCFIPLTIPLKNPIISIEVLLILLFYLLNSRIYYFFVWVFVDDTLNITEQLECIATSSETLFLQVV